MIKIIIYFRHIFSGKGESNWDRLTHTNPEAIADQSNGDIACDTYSKTKQDVQLLKFLGVDFYRFSISWTRILPNGKTDYINPDGIRYYSDLIDELLANNITPMVTMYHWDLPQTLEEEGGWTNLALVDYFTEYANILFERFGDRVKTWITFNEASHICHFGYGGDLIAPMLKDKVAAYQCGKTVILAHAKVYHLYNERYREVQKGVEFKLDMNFFIIKIVLVLFKDVLGYRSILSGLILWRSITKTLMQPSQL